MYKKRKTVNFNKYKTGFQKTYKRTSLKKKLKKKHKKKRIRCCVNYKTQQIIKIPHFLKREVKRYIKIRIHEKEKKNKYV